jgi:hypothetical protein
MNTSFASDIGTNNFPPVSSIVSSPPRVVNEAETVISQQQHHIHQDLHQQQQGQVFNIETMATPQQQQRRQDDDNQDIDVEISNIPLGNIHSTRSTISTRPEDDSSLDTGMVLADVNVSPSYASRESGQSPNMSALTNIFPNQHGVATTTSNSNSSGSNSNSSRAANDYAVNEPSSIVKLTGVDSLMFAEDSEHQHHNHHDADTDATEHAEEAIGLWQDESSGDSDIDEDIDQDDEDDDMDSEYDGHEDGDDGGEVLKS